MMTSLKKTGLFPGTFDPFTMGHLSLVTRGLALLDEVVIAIGVNEAKSEYFTVDQRLQMIRKLFENDDRVRVMSYRELTVDFARECGAGYILRGIRTVNDFEYEKTIADINRKISGIETLILFTEPELTHVSSTIVRELLRYGKDVSQFIPPGMNLEEYRSGN